MVKHKALIKVNEQGTEAAAATAVIRPGSAVPKVEEHTVDRPFIFLMRDHATGAMVFVGRVVNDGCCPGQRPGQRTSPRSRR